jgi:hypothetical protein
MNGTLLFGIAVNYTTQCHQQHIEKCPVHLVSLIKHHGLFVPYIVANFTPPNQTFFFTLFTLFTLTYARQRQHHTPTLRSLEPYYYSAYIADLTGFSGKKCPPHLVHQGLFSPYIIVINFDIEAIPPDFQNGGYMISFVRCSFLSVRQSSHPVQLTCILWRKDAKGKCPFKS